MPDGNSQSIDVDDRAEEALENDADAGDARSDDQTHDRPTPAACPSPAVRVVVDFDKNAKLFTKGLPTCNAGAAAEHLDRSRPAELRQGEDRQRHSRGAAPGRRQIFPVDQDGDRLQRRARKAASRSSSCTPTATTPVQTTLVLNGVVSNYNKEGYGPRLDVEVPLIAGGAGALTDFKVKINKKYNYKGEADELHQRQMPEHRRS